MIGLLSVAVLLVAGCGSEPPGGAPPPPPGGAVSPIDGERRAQAVPALSALLISPREPIVPFNGTDGRSIASFELGLQNATPFTLTPTVVEVLAPDGAVVQRLDQTAVTAALALPGRRGGVGQLAEAQTATLFLTVAFPTRAAVPDRLDTRITVTADGLPPGGVTSAPTSVPVSPIVPPVVGPPLAAGKRYIAADSCCDSPRHRRATVALDNRLWLAQRFAVDWEQIDASGRTVVGPDPGNPADYAIYGRTVIAAASGTVIRVLDGLPDQRPGALPPLGDPATADGNSVVIDIGRGLYTLYGHMQSGSIRVREGEQVTRGQPIGLVGNSGNTSAPHLHFHVMDGPAPLTSEGVPYVIDSFATAGRIASLAAFDQLENTVDPLPVLPLPTDGEHRDQMPLNFDLVDFR